MLLALLEYPDVHGDVGRQQATPSQLSEEDPGGNEVFILGRNAQVGPAL